MVSIIIVNYNSLHLIEDCIESIIARTSGIDYEIIVVDYTYQPCCGYMICRRFGGRVRTLELPDNVGFGGANNEGFNIARGEYLFCLNPDTLLVNNAVKMLAECLDCYPQAGACGGNLFGPDMRKAHSFRRITPGLFWEISERLRRHPERLIFGRNTRFNKSSRIKSVGYITGADLMLRRTALEQTGGFSPEFFMYFEDTDLCRRLRKLGWKLLSVPQAKIIHLEGGSFKTDDSEETRRKMMRRIEMYEQNRHTYYRLHHSPLMHRLCDAIHRPPKI